MVDKVRSYVRAQLISVNDEDRSIPMSPQESLALVYDLSSTRQELGHEANRNISVNDNWIGHGQQKRDVCHLAPQMLCDEDSDDISILAPLNDKVHANLLRRPTFITLNCADSEETAAMEPKLNNAKLVHDREGRTLPVDIEHWRELTFSVLYTRRTRKKKKDKNEVDMSRSPERTRGNLSKRGRKHSGIQSTELTGLATTSKFLNMRRKATVSHLHATFV